MRAPNPPESKMSPGAALLRRVLVLHHLLAAAVIGHAAAGPAVSPGPTGNPGKLTCKINPGTFLVATASPSVWISDSGDFAFGFRQMRGGFLLAIWFDKIPDKTIVWWAYQGILVQENSRAGLTNDGTLVLVQDGHPSAVWSVGGGAACASMGDDGNLVLSGSGGVVWQSFDHPTDTLLPGQIMRSDTKLVSRFLETDFSLGRFQVVVQKDGNLVFYTTNYPQVSVNFAYWSTDTVGAEGVELVFSQTGSLFFRSANAGILRQLLNSSDVTGGKRLYQRATLDYRGVLLQYVQGRGAAGGNWTAVGVVAEDICTRITAPTGAGVCGFNGYCVTRPTGVPGVSVPECRCPPGYVRLEDKDELGGCRPNFAPPSCVGGRSAAAGEYAVERMNTTDWPVSDYEHYEGVEEGWCEARCLEDCLCAVAIFKTSGDCWKKKIPLSNGRFEAANERVALIKVKKGG